MSWSICRIACGTLIAAACAHAADPAVIRVAPDGNDAGSGPYRTLARARDAAREIRAAQPDAPIGILLAPGIYALTETLVFTPEDSGTPLAPLTIRSESDRATISGGIPIANWKDRDDGLWEIDWYALAGKKVTLSALFVDGKFRGPCRTPNADFFFTAGKAPATTDASGAEVDRANTAFVYNDGEVKNWPDIAQAVILSYHSWDVSHNRIASLDEPNRIVNFRQPVTWAFENWGPKQRYVVQHVREALDAPGEWYLDQSTGILLYMPMPGETPGKTSVIAPVLDVLIAFQGDPANGKFVEHVRFENLTFAHTNYPVPEAGIKDDQAAYTVNAAIMADGARHTSFERCEITDTSNYAIWYRTGCQNNRVANSRLHHLGAGGVRIGNMASPATPAEAAEFNRVENCHIYDGGYHLPEAIGVWIGRASYNTVAHNDIHDFYYTGVSIGWLWGYDATTANHNLVEFNHIHHLGKGVLSDMGGVYHLGIAPGTIIRNNLIHDVKGYYYGAWGLYTDEGSSDVIMENNVVYNTQTGGFHQHYGRDNRITNNILAFSEREQVIRSREEDHISFYFERNIVYYDNDTLLGSNWTNGNFRMDANCYWTTTGNPILFKEKTFDQWRATGQDLRSIIADPLFVDAKNRDFRLKPESPVFALGFNPIDLTNVGPVGYVGP